MIVFEALLFLISEVETEDQRKIPKMEARRGYARRTKQLLGRFHSVGFWIQFKIRNND